MINGDKSQDIGDAERRSLIEIKEAIVRVQTAPAMDIIAEGKLERKEVQKELGVEIEKFDPNDPTLSEKVRERIDELKAEGKEIVAFYDKVTKKIFINQNAKDEEVRASIAREYKIKEDLELGRGKENDEGQLRSTVAKAGGITAVVVGGNRFITGFFKFMNGLYGSGKKKTLNPIRYSISKKYQGYYDAFEITVEVGIMNIAQYA